MSVRTFAPCALRAPCLRKPETSVVRTVAFLRGREGATTETHTMRMQQRLDAPEGREQYGQRFATVKRLDRFTLRGRTKVHGNGGPGEISRFNGVTNALNASLSANLLKHVGSFTLRSTVRGLMERETNDLVNASGQIFSTPGVNSLNNATVRFVNSTSETIRTNSFFVSGAADYRGKLIVDGLARMDGSSLFGPEEQENWYYRGSAAYRISEETWFPLKNIFNEFKLRASQGTAGGRPDFNDQYETFNFIEGGGLVKQNLGNKFLKPEYSKETEIGIDAIVKNRYSIQLSHARQVTSEQLLLIPLAGYFGYANQWQNAGTVTGNTLEGTIEAQIVRKPTFTWRAGVVADRSRNKITEFNRPCFTTNTVGFRCAGETLGNMYGFRFIGNVAELPAAAKSRANEFARNDEGLLVYVGAGNAYTDGEVKRLWGTPAVTIGSQSYQWGMPVRATDSTGNAAVTRIGDGNPDFRFGAACNYSCCGTRRLAATCTTRRTSACISTSAAVMSIRLARRRS